MMAKNNELYSKTEIMPKNNDLDFNEDYSVR